MKNQKIAGILAASVLVSNIFTSAIFAEQMNIDIDIQDSIKTALSKNDDYYKEKLKPFKPNNTATRAE